ncbi:hypothetical protein B0H17DRAFT_1257561 [Mycena rosella]|uniref:MYND-type domain-containing protein n=1 Tax=Mycena rosella TaxID=1033263 RepID=A0AAD7G3P9_MYCRO|nr:hypothetical protein B0H17DRAFT_1257561 [Mycena rosella]
MQPHGAQANAIKLTNFRKAKRSDAVTKMARNLFVDSFVRAKRIGHVEERKQAINDLDSMLQLNAEMPAISIGVGRRPWRQFLFEPQYNLLLERITTGQYELDSPQTGLDQNAGSIDQLSIPSPLQLPSEKMPDFFPQPTDMLSSMLGSMRDRDPVSVQSIAESFGLLDGKWKDFVADKCTFGQRMIAGMNHGKFAQKTFGKNPALEPLTNELASLHLPALVQAYISAYEKRKPLAENWMDSWERYYAYVLRDCLNTMYFSRWMRGHPPEAVSLMATLADQIAEFPLEWPEVCEAQRQLERLEIFMWVALRTRQCAPKHAVHISLETRTKAITYLKNLKKLVTSELKTPKWRKDLAKDHLTMALNHIENALMHYLDGEQRFGGKSDLTGKPDHDQRWDVCGAKSSNCSVSDKHKLRECAKCHTVRYCCPEHQRQHWKEHKPTCFAPAY